MPNRRLYGVERRFLPIAAAHLEMRENAEKRPELAGYAAVFNSETVIAEAFREEFAPGAFAKTLQEADIRALFNHDPSVVLGRNKAGTLTLVEDSVGLRAVIQPPDSEWGRPVVEAVRRGDITGMSIAFRPIKQEWFYPPDRRSGELPKRTVREAMLADVAPCTFPYYPQTSLLARADGAPETREDELDVLLQVRQLVLIARHGYELTGSDRELIAAAAEVLRRCVPAGEPTVADGHSSTARTSDAGTPGGPGEAHSEEARVCTHELRKLRMMLAEVA